MKIITGLNEAKQILTSNRGPNFHDLSPKALRKTSDALGKDVTLVEAVEIILDRVRNEGDSAIREISNNLGSPVPENFQVTSSEIRDAYKLTPQNLIEAMKLAAERIRKFHETSLETTWMDSNEGYGEMIVPIQRVGAYVPAGTASLFSTVLMTAIPAKVAGVQDVIVCSPSTSDNNTSTATLVAADIAGVDNIFQVGGAQAIAAMAYGTESISSVDLICGPGNIFVTLAKKLLFGEVGIDGLYGPTETMIIADQHANPTLCAADLLAQAEHDVLATPILITTSENLANDVQKEIKIRSKSLNRSEIIKESINRNGYIVVLEKLDQAFDIANQFAPEHLSLMIADPSKYLDSIKNAGAVFLGDFSHEVLGDYVAGPSHVMPTGGTARFNSGLNVRSFLKTIPVVAINSDESKKLNEAASILARAEKLTGHAEAAEIRQELL